MKRTKARTAKRVADKRQTLTPEERGRKLEQALTLGKAQLGWIHGGLAANCDTGCCNWACGVSY
jgi:hypothetical protein